MRGVYSALYLYVQTYLLPRSPALAPHEDSMSIAQYPITNICIYILPSFFFEDIMSIAQYLITNICLYILPPFFFEDIMSIARITTRKNKGQSPGQTHRAEGSEEGGRTGKRKRKLPRGGWYPPFGLHHETDTRPHRVRTVLMYLTTYAY